MYLSSLLVSFSLSAIVLAGQSFDFNTNILNHEMLPLSLSQNFICSIRDGSGLAVHHHHYSEVCQQEHHNHSHFLTVPHETTNSKGGPWTSKPQCMEPPDNETLPLCIFTSSTFAYGRGISIFTDPDTAQQISSMPAFRDADALSFIKGLNGDSSPPFEVRPLPGRGLGVIANRTIEAGDLIMSYTATTIFHDEAFDELAAEGSIFLRRTVEGLPQHSRKIWMDLAAHFEGKDIIQEKINTNAFSEDFNEEEHYVVIPEIAVRSSIVLELLPWSEC